MRDAILMGTLNQVIVVYWLLEGYAFKNRINSEAELGGDRDM